MNRFCYVLLALESESTNVRLSRKVEVLYVSVCVSFHLGLSSGLFRFHIVHQTPPPRVDGTSDSLTLSEHARTSGLGEDCETAAIAKEHFD